MHEWVNLTTRIGESIQNPQTDQLRAALEELFASKDEEHPDSWVECGSEQGPLYSLTFFYSGRGIYTKYSDVDMTDELESPRAAKATAFSLRLRLHYKAALAAGVRAIYRS